MFEPPFAHHNQSRACVSNCMQRQLAAFVGHPSKTTFLAARDAVLNESPLPLLAVEIAEFDRLLDQEEYQTLLDRLDLLPPSKVLSPRIHFLAAEAADALGHSQDVELERCLFVITLRGLLATGDGTPGNPYVVCHTTDEHDILEALGLQASRQSVVENEGRLCDCLVCSNGREVWFDVTKSIARPKLRGGRRRSVSCQPLRPRRAKVSR